MAQTKLEPRAVHVFEKVGQTGAYRLARTNPLMRFQQKEQILYIQAGKVFSEEGGMIPKDQVPAWLTDEISKANKAALAECGWTGK